MEANVKTSSASRRPPFGPSYSEESVVAGGAHPNRLLATSADLGWSSLLLNQLEAQGQSDVFETRATPDLTLLVAVSGSHELQASHKRQWYRALYQPGASGAILPMETAQLRWRGERGTDPFQTAHLYLPAATLAATAEEYRRAGQRCDVHPCSTLALADTAVAQVVVELVRAMRLGASELYPEQAGVWLAAHLLFRHARRLDPEDGRHPGSISDRRLSRTIEFMSANLEKPLTLGQLAREAGISLHHFGKLFKQQTGRTPAAMLTSMRMEDARRMLLTSNISIAEIALRRGYSRPTAFSTAFMRHYGETPSETRGRAQIDGRKKGRIS